MEQTISTAIQELINMVKTTAPEVWRIALQQVNVQTFRALLAILIGIAVALFSILYLSPRVKRNREIAYKAHVARYYEKRLEHDMRSYEDANDPFDDSSYTVAIGLVYAAVIGGAIIVVASLSDIIGYVGNPEFAAINILIGLVK